MINAAKQLTTTATLITPPTTIETGWSATIINLGPLTVYVGGPTVTTTTGIPIASGATLNINGGIGQLYGVTTVLQVTPADLRVVFH